MSTCHFPGNAGLFLETINTNAYHLLLKNL